MVNGASQRSCLVTLSEILPRPKCRRLWPELDCPSARSLFIDEKESFVRSQVPILQKHVAPAKKSRFVGASGLNA